MIGLIATMLLAPAQVWYGPAEAVFRVQFGGNPYDPAVNDVRVRFTPDKGPAQERLAYFDEKAGAWKAILVTKEPGRYLPVLLRNGVAQQVASEPMRLSADKKLPRGFLRTSKVWTNRLQWDDGSFYYPFGINVAWQGGDGPTVPEHIKKMGEAGLNWVRVWACHWDGKNPFWSNDKAVKLAPGELWPAALEKWDEILKTSEASGVGLQWTLFHHGPWSTRVNSNWGENPWNATNGGWLKTPSEFFTDPEAKRRVRIYLRHLVARYAHSPALISWELFNEVEWVDPRYSGNWADVLAWHKEMAGYLRELDPYQRLVTTSSTYEEPGLYEFMDYEQPHSYSSNPFAPMSQPLRATKPAFFGEFGTEPYVAAKERFAVRDGVLASAFAGHSGPAAYWYWDRAINPDFMAEFKRLSEVLAKADVANHPDARPLSVRAETAMAGNLSISPTIGWGKSLKTSFVIPDDASTGSLPISAYLQSVEGDHKDFNPEGFRFRTNLKEAGQFRVRLVQVSRGGGTLRLACGSEKVEKAFAGGAAERNQTEWISIQVPKGPQEVRLTIHGPDWLRIAEIEVQGAGSLARAHGIGQRDWMALRVTSLSDSLVPVSLGSLSLGDGKYEVEEFDLDTGKVRTTQASVSQSGLSWTPQAKDVVLMFRPARP